MPIQEKYKSTRWKFIVGCVVLALASQLNSGAHPSIAGLDGISYIPGVTIGGAILGWGIWWLWANFKN